MDKQTVLSARSSNAELATICNLTKAAIQHSEDTDPAGGSPYSTINMAKSTQGGWDHVLELAGDAPTTTLVDEDGATMTFDRYSGEVVIKKNGQELVTMIMDDLDEWMIEHPEAGIYYNGWSVQREPAEVINLEEVRERRGQ
jgi:hypothetical protein